MTLCVVRMLKRRKATITNAITDMNFQSEPLKTIIVLLLYFTCWLGWIGLFLINAFYTIPNKWYIVLPILGLTCWWAFFMHGVATRYRRSGNG